MKPLLQVDNLSVDFQLHQKKLSAVRNVSWSLNECECIGIVGESGSGKSVMTKSALQLLPSNLRTSISGNVIYHDTNLLTLPEKKMRRIRGKEIGIISQDSLSALNPTMKIGKQIMEGYLLHFSNKTKAEARIEALNLLRAVGIPDPHAVFDSYPFTLSGGMRQRITIAIALIARPKILIADEPTTALDVTIQAQILNLLKKLQKEFSMSVILITHDLSVIAGFCSRVLVMYAGQIVESAPVDQLFAAPQHPYTQGLLAAIPRLNNDKSNPLIPIRGRPPNPMDLPKGCAFCMRCPKAMNICLSQPPPSVHNNDHSTTCWLPHKPSKQSANKELVNVKT